MYLLLVFGAFWCKSILWFKGQCPGWHFVFSFPQCMPAPVIYFEKIDWPFPRHLTFPWQPHFVLLVKPYVVFFGKILFFQFSCLTSTRNVSICSTGWGMSTKFKIILMRLSNQNESLRWFHPASISTTVVVTICLYSSES